MEKQTKKTANPCNRQVKPKDAYEVWQAGEFTYWVLRKYKSPEAEAKDPFATWYCAVKSPATDGSFEFGDCYVADIKNGGVLVDNPLVNKHTDDRTN